MLKLENITVTAGGWGWGPEEFLHGYQVSVTLNKEIIAIRSTEAPTVNNMVLYT